MNKHFKLFIEILTFGVPLFVRVLSKSRKFQRLANQKVFVVYHTSENKVYVRSEKSKELLIVLDVDQLDYVCWLPDNSRK